MERPKVEGEQNQQLISVKSFAEAHGLGEKEAAYALADQGVELLFDAVQVQVPELQILQKATEVGDSLKKREARLKRDRERMRDIVSADPEAARVTWRMQKANSLKKRNQQQQPT